MEIISHEGKYKKKFIFAVSQNQAITLNSIIHLSKSMKLSYRFIAGGFLLN